MYLVSKQMFFCFFLSFQNRLQAKTVNNNYMDPNNLMFTDIIILGMDKKPTDFTVLHSNSATSVSNVAYNVSSKVGDCSILQGPCQKPGPTILTASSPLLFSLWAGSETASLLQSLPYHRAVTGETMRAKYGLLSFVCIRTLKKTVGAGTLRQGSSSLGRFKTRPADPRCDIVKI